VTEALSQSHSAPAASEPLLRCEIHPRDRSVVLAVTGELDLSTVGEVEAELTALRNAGVEHLILDLHALDFIDSSGLRLLVTWTRAAQDGGPRLSVVDGPGVHRALALASLHDVLDMLPVSAAR
jgi:anti-sigma B factor antagonist